MIVEQCINKGLKKPAFIQDMDFSVILYRSDWEVTNQINTQVTGQVTEKINILLKVVNNQVISMREIMRYLSLSGRDNFLKEYLNPAIEQGLVSMKFPQSPNHPKQRYYLTQKGLEIKDNIEKSKNDE